MPIAPVAGQTSDPSPQFFAITPSDTVDLDYIPRSVYVGTTGDVVCVDHSGNTVTFKNVQQGTWLPVMPKRVNSTNTTAQNLVALV